MKKLLTLTATCMLLSAPAIAVQKCVYKPTMDNWGVCYNGTDGLSDGHGGWNIECNDIVYRGIATYSTSDVGDVAEYIDSSVDTPSGVFCYCKMIYPVLSKWIKVSSVEIPTIEDGGITYIPTSVNDSCAGFCVEYGDEGEGYASTLIKFLNNLEEN